MKRTFLKHNTLNFISLLICFALNTHINCFGLQIKLSKTPITDRAITTDHYAQKLKDIKPIMFNGRDGPYIINDTLLYHVNSENKLVVSPILRKDSVVVRSDNKEVDEFYVSLEPLYTIPETRYRLPEKMIVISDIEGNYNAFSSFLQSNKIMDENHNWIYGNGHLVLVGDFVDRGKNVTQVLWLIYKLEHQAKKHNGVVHFILGNHEILNFHGNHKYNRGKYIKAAQEISQLKDKKEAIKFLYSNKSELGKWLATKNVIEKIGEYLFVHGGLSPEILDYELDLENINNLVRYGYGGLKNIEDQAVHFLYGSKGPFWYRGLVLKRYNYEKINSLALEGVLRYYEASKVIIGHTPVKTISSDFNGRVIRADVHHGNKKKSQSTQGLLIENCQEFVIDANGSKRLLQY